MVCFAKTEHMPLLPGIQAPNGLSNILVIPECTHIAATKRHHTQDQYEHPEPRFRKYILGDESRSETCPDQASRTGQHEIQVWLRRVSNFVLKINMKPKKDRQIQ